MGGSGQRHRHKCHQSMATSIARLRACCRRTFRTSAAVKLLPETEIMLLMAQEIVLQRAVYNLIT